MAIQFHNEDITYRLKQKRLLKSWISECISAENQICGNIQVILCSDEYLLKMNQDFLNHDYYTDIITFNYNSEKINGDLFISLDRIKYNADKNGVNVEDEMQRVIIHGVMHLCGFNDKKKSDRIAMRKQEEKCLVKYENLRLTGVSRGTKN